MALFRKKEEDYEEEDEELEIPKRKIRDLKPENKKARKEVVKPWGKFERLFVLFVLLATVLTSGILALSARNFKLPNLPVIKMPDLNEINPFKEQTIVVGNRGNAISQAKIDMAKKEFKSMANGFSGIYAFYIYDLKGGYYYGLNHQEKMQAASLIKLPVMYLGMKENQDKLLIEAMGKRSDNNAYLKMVNILGRENINRAIKDLGMINTSLSENKTTPEEVGLYFKKLYLNEILNEEKSLELQSYMTDTIFEDWIVRGIPESEKVVHKYGRESRSVSDAGIVFSSRPFVLVIMSDGVIESEADNLIPKLANMLYWNQIRE